MMPRDYIQFTLISAEGVDERVRVLRAFLSGEDYKLTSRSVSIEVAVPAEGKLAKKLKKFIRKDMGLSAGAAEGRLVRLWEPAELRDVGWHQAEFSYEPDGYAGTEFDNQPDLSGACPACGTGSTIQDPIRTDWKPKKRGLHQLLTGEWIVNEAVRNAFEEAGVAGVTYRTLVHEKSGKVLDGIFLLEPSGVAPPAHASAPLEQDAHCPACGADGWGPAKDAALRFIYASGQLPADADVLWTFEAIGRARGHLGGKRRLLISRKAHDVLKKLMVRGLEYRPVEIVD
jgi:hypothetical protein